jgi:ATP-dependent Clp protease adaptor protein ClpS
MRPFSLARQVWKLRISICKSALISIPGFLSLNKISAAMSTSTDTQHDLIVEKESARTAPPPMYQVVLLNDDYTPMEFVVSVLQKFFSKSEEEATRIMLQVHNEGRGVCGVYPRDIAATRVAQVAQYARAKQHPLQCVMEPL